MLFFTASDFFLMVTVKMEKMIKFGVPQGSVWGPLPYLLYTANIPAISSKHFSTGHLYADDVQALIHGPIPIQLTLTGRTDALSRFMAYISAIQKTGPHMAHTLSVNQTYSPALSETTPPLRLFWTIWPSSRLDYVFLGWALQLRGIGNKPVPMGPRSIWSYSRFHPGSLTISTLHF